MRSVIFDRPGDASVLQLVFRPNPEPGVGEVRVRIIYSGVNPTDWKNRRSAHDGNEVVANQDGSGVIDALGPGLGPDEFAVGDRVWLTLSGYERPSGGTAQEYVVVPVERVFALPSAASFELGAAIGIPALTAHEALVAGQGMPDRLRPGALAGKTILVAGGAGAVGNAAIQLARWAGGRVVATVSTDEKGRLSAAAGAELTVNYRSPDAAAEIRGFAPGGVDIVVEVAPVANAALNHTVLARRGTVAVYSVDGGAELTIQVGAEIGRNSRYQFVLLYTAGWDAIARDAQSVTDAIAAGGLRVGRDAGLPVHSFALAEAAEAHAAVEAGTTGKVLIRTQE
jgi:NADPH2:quinone reductase